MPDRPPLGVNPGDAADVLKTLLAGYELAAERMLIIVTRRLARGITRDGWAEEKAREILALRDELLKILTLLDIATPRLALQALTEAYKLGQRAAAVLGQPLVSRPDAILAIARDYVTQLHGTHTGILRAHEDVFRRAVAESEQLMATGTIVRREAVAQTVDRLVAAGHDRFEDSAGRRWHLDAYARMAGRTAAGRLAVQGQLDEMAASGRDVVVISDSPRECPQCRRWEGRLLSISGVSVGQVQGGREVVGTVAAARASGLWHPNCTHRADPYVPGLTRLPAGERNPAGYEAQQRLRALERRARDLKRREAAAREFGDTATGRKLRERVRVNSLAIREHTERTGVKRRRDRERPVG